MNIPNTQGIKGTMAKTGLNKNRHKLIVSINGFAFKRNINEPELNNKLTSLNVSAQACLRKPLQLLKHV